MVQSFTPLNRNYRVPTASLSSVHHVRFIDQFSSVPLIEPPLFLSPTHPRSRLRSKPPTRSQPHATCHTTTSNIKKMTQRRRGNTFTLLTIMWYVFGALVTGAPVLESEASLEVPTTTTDSTTPEPVTQLGSVAHTHIASPIDNSVVAVDSSVATPTHAKPAGGGWWSWWGWSWWTAQYKSLARAAEVRSVDFV